MRNKFFFGVVIPIWILLILSSIPVVQQRGFDVCVSNVISSGLKGRYVLDVSWECQVFFNDRWVSFKSWDEIYGEPK